MASLSRSVCCLACILVLSLSLHVAAQTLSLPLDTIALPPGFEIALYTSTAVPNARTLVLSDNTSGGNIVYVSTNSLNNVRRASVCSMIAAPNLAVESVLTEAGVVGLWTYACICRCMLLLMQTKTALPSLSSQLLTTCLHLWGWHTQTALCG